MARELHDINIEDNKDKTVNTTKSNKPKKKATKASKATRIRKSKARRKSLKEKRLENSVAGVGHTTAIGALGERIRHIKGFNLFVLIVYVIAIVALILISFFKIDIPIVEVCSLVVLEAVLAAILSKLAPWVHLLCVGLQLLCGFFLSMVNFTIANIIVYILSVLLILVWMKDEY